MYKRIMVALDQSFMTSRVLETAIELAKSTGAQIVGVYVIDPFPYIGIGDASAVGLQAYLAEAKTAAGQALDMLGKACKEQGVPFAGDTIERNVVHEGILETATSEGCDLIVMGSHGHRGIKSLILGSVAQKVLAHATQPVLIVKV